MDDPSFPSLLEETIPSAKGASLSGINIHVLKSWFPSGICSTVREKRGLSFDTTAPRKPF